MLPIWSQTNSLYIKNHKHKAELNKQNVKLLLNRAAKGWLTRELMSIDFIEKSSPNVIKKSVTTNKLQQVFVVLVNQLYACIWEGVISYLIASMNKSSETPGVSLWRQYDLTPIFIVGLLRWLLHLKNIEHAHHAGFLWIRTPMPCLFVHHVVH